MFGRNDQLQYLLEQRFEETDWIDNTQHNHQHNDTQIDYFRQHHEPEVNNGGHYNADADHHHIQHQTSFQSKKSHNAYNHSELRKLQKKRPDSYKYVSPFVLSAEKRAQIRIKESKAKENKLKEQQLKREKYDEMNSDDKHQIKPSSKAEWKVDIKLTDAPKLFSDMTKKGDTPRSPTRSLKRTPNSTSNQNGNNQNVNSNIMTSPQRAANKLTVRTNGVS